MQPTQPLNTIEPWQLAETKALPPIDLEEANEQQLQEAQANLQLVSHTLSTYPIAEPGSESEEIHEIGSQSFEVLVDENQSDESVQANLQLEVQPTIDAKEIKNKLHHYLDEETVLGLAIVMSVLGEEDKELTDQAVLSYLESMLKDIYGEDGFQVNDDLFLDLFVPENLNELSPGIIEKIQWKAYKFLTVYTDVKIDQIKLTQESLKSLEQVIPKSRERILKQLKQHELSDIVIDKKLGEGGVGEAYRCGLGDGRAIKVRGLGHSVPLGVFRDRSELEEFIQMTQGHEGIMDYYEFTKVNFGGGWQDVDVFGEMTGKVRDLDQAPELKRLNTPRRNDSIMSFLDGKAKKISDALAHSHEAGFIHRDIKPSNILINGRGELQIIDWDVALKEDSPYNRPSDNDRIFGTPMYMSPEQALNQKITTKSDIFSYGVMLYHLFGGKPASTSSVQAVLYSNVFGNPVPDLHQLGLPQDLADLIEQCVAKSPEDRPTAREVSEKIGEIMSQYEEGELQFESVARVQQPLAPPPLPNQEELINEEGQMESFSVLDDFNQQVDESVDTSGVDLDKTFEMSAETIKRALGTDDLLITGSIDSVHPFHEDEPLNPKKTQRVELKKPVDPEQFLPEFDAFENLIPKESVNLDEIISHPNEVSEKQDASKEKAQMIPTMDRLDQYIEDLEKFEFDEQYDEAMDIKIHLKLLLSDIDDPNTENTKNTKEQVQKWLAEANKKMKEWRKLLRTPRLELARRQFSVRREVFQDSMKLLQNLSHNAMVQLGDEDWFEFDKKIQDLEIAQNPLDRLEVGKMRPGELKTQIKKLDQLIDQVDELLEPILKQQDDAIQNYEQKRDQVIQKRIVNWQGPKLRESLKTAALRLNRIVGQMDRQKVKYDPELVERLRRGIRADELENKAAIDFAPSEEVSQMNESLFDLQIQLLKWKKELSRA